MAMSRDDLNIMENHIITILMAGVLGLGGWNLYATNGLQQATVSNHQHVTGEIKIVDLKVDALKENFSIRTLDRYTGSDASRDKAELKNAIHIIKIEHKMFSDRLSKHIEYCEKNHFIEAP